MLLTILKLRYLQFLAACFLMLAFLFLQQALNMYLLRQLDTTVISGTSEFDIKH